MNAKDREDDAREQTLVNGIRVLTGFARSLGWYVEAHHAQNLYTSYRVTLTLTITNERLGKRGG